MQSRMREEDEGGIPDWLYEKMREASKVREEARKRFVQLAMGKTRKARKVTKKKTVRKK